MKIKRSQKNVPSKAKQNKMATKVPLSFIKIYCLNIFQLKKSLFKTKANQPNKKPNNWPIGNSIPPGHVEALHSKQLLLVLAF